MQETDPVRGICGAHGGYKTTEVRDVGRTGGGRGLLEGSGRRMDEVSPGTSQSFRYRSRSVWTTAIQDEGEWRKTAEQRAGRLMVK